MTEKAPNWTKADLHGIKTYLASINWEDLFHNKSAEEARELLKDKIRIATKKFVPKSTMKSSTEPKWLNREIIKLIRQKKQA